ncbi:MAG: hypothetical protein A2288_01810 [Candidatus Moranbacteria bacterium RIFOXYA12_FULL_44_15]|nr:MAG: hypothetical protein A2288_01810 [Candidatus Moranbacteria bacterium RIFOXYA12_FULL_44_15]OGI34251.1 MAG: hypothetical protein A2259_04240 [Candidatus Moranbacteria bacterium RIFOXYA2_FULL_43_15]
MPNGHEKKKHGGHDYGNREGTCDCKHGCGCWAGPSRSGGPVGLDPFGKCPSNPVDGKRRPGQIDYKDVVEQRIQDLETRLHQAEDRLRQVEPEKIKLAEELASVQGKLIIVTNRFQQVFKISSRVLDFLGIQSV